MLSTYTQLGFSCTRSIQLRLSSSFSSSFLIPFSIFLYLASLFLFILLSHSLPLRYGVSYDSHLDIAIFAVFWTTVWTGSETENILTKGSTPFHLDTHSLGQVTVIPTVFVEQKKKIKNNKLNGNTISNDSHEHV